MKYKEYTSLIRQLEKYAQENPKKYELRVNALGALGYGYFGMLILLFFVLPILFVGLIFFIPQLLYLVLKLGKLLLLALLGFATAFGAIWSGLRAIWTKIPPPEGIELQKESAPQLFELVEKTSSFLKAPRPHHILLTEEFNAAVVTLPRYGVFGKRVYLIVGLPLMQALSPHQFEAVIAHEIGHISERHGKFASRAYRLRETWGRFIEAQEVQGHSFSVLYARFLNWYFPYFNAYSFVLCREHEREADKYAAKLVGAQPLGEALINIEIKNRNLNEKFWNEVLSGAAHEKSPPPEIYTKMALAFRENNKPVDLMNLSKAVAINTDYSDSHPSLSERLKTIGYWKDSDLPELPPEAEHTAAEKYLGKLEKEVSDIFNSEWREKVKPHWRQRHEYLLKAEKRLEELDAKAHTQELTEDEFYEKCCLLAERFGEKESLESLRNLLEKYPDYAPANYGLGCLLLNQDDESGIEYIRKAYALDRSFLINGCETIHYYLKSKGRDDEADNYILAIEDEQEIIGLAQMERSVITENDSFETHKMPPETIEKIRHRLQYYEEVQSAYLVRKKVKHYEEMPLHVLFFDTKKRGMIFKGDVMKTEDFLQAMVERLSEFGIHYFIVFEKDFKNMKPRIEKIEGAEIYRRQ